MRRPPWLLDPAASSLLLFIGLIIIGFVAIGIGDREIARTLFLDVQVPALVSGGMAGLAVILVGCSLLNVQAGRRLSASERADTELLLEEAAQLVEALRSSRG